MHLIPDQTLLGRGSKVERWCWRCTNPPWLSPSYVRPFRGRALPSTIPAAWPWSHLRDRQRQGNQQPWCLPHLGEFCLVNRNLGRSHRPSSLTDVWEHCI